MNSNRPGSGAKRVKETLEERRDRLRSLLTTRQPGTTSLDFEDDEATDVINLALEQVKEITTHARKSAEKCMEEAKEVTRDVAAVLRNGNGKHV